MSDQDNNLILYEHELKVKTAALIVLNSILKNKKNNSRRRRWWTTHLFKQREAGPDLMEHLEFDKTTGQFRNFIRMASED